MNIKNIFAIALLIISVCLCQVKDRVKHVSKAPPQALYEVERFDGFKANYARYEIDGGGGVHTYHIWTWGQSNKVTYSAQELSAAFNLYDTLHKIINKDTLLWSYKLAAKAISETKIDSLHNVIYDAPDCYYYVYWFLPEINKYQRFTLAKGGSQAYYNPSESAKLLVAWLNKTFFPNWIINDIYSK